LSSKKEQYIDEITLQEVVVSSAKILSWLKSHGLRLLVICGITTALSIYWASSKEDQYTATVSFILSDDNNPQISSVGGVLGQLGLPIPSGRYNVDKLMGIAKTRGLVESTLLIEVPLEGKEDILANHIIDIFGLGDVWSTRDERFKQFRFSEYKAEVAKDLENYAMKQLINLFAGSQGSSANGLLIADYGRSDYIMTLSLKTPSEALSIAYVNHHFDNLLEYYTSKASAKNQSVYNLISAKSDSLNQVIVNTAREIAQLRDRASTSFRSTDNVRLLLLEAELRGLQANSEEIMRNLGRAQYLLETSTPLIQLLDRPRPPLTKETPSILKYGLLGGIIGFILYLLMCFLSLVLGYYKRQNSYHKNS